MISYRSEKYDISIYIYICLYISQVGGKEVQLSPTGKWVSVSCRVRVVHAYEHEAKLRGRVRDDAFPLLVVVSGRFVLPALFSVIFGLML